MSIASTLSFAFGPLAGIGMYTRFGFDWVLYSCILAGTVTLTTGVFIDETFKASVKKERDSFAEVFLRRVVLASSGIVFIMALLYGGLFTFLPILLTSELHLNAGVFFTINSVSLVVFRYFISPLLDRYGLGPVFFYSFLITLASLIIISNIQSMNLMIIAAVLYGLGSAGCLPALTTLLVDTPDQMERGSVFSVFYGAFDIGVLAAGIILGAVADMLGYRDMFSLVAVGGLVALIMFSMFIQPGVLNSILWTVRGNKTSA